jgi:hypothetical protein
MCTVLLPPGVNPIAVNKYIMYHISYHVIIYHIITHHIISYIISSYHIIYHIISYMNDCVLIQHLPVGLSNGSALCSHWITKWVFMTSVMYTHSPAYHYGSAVRTVCPCEIYTHVLKMGPVSLRIIRFSALGSILPVLSSIIALYNQFIRRPSGHEHQTIRHWGNAGRKTVLILSFVPAISAFPCQYHSVVAL